MTRAKSVPAKTAKKIEQLGWEVRRTQPYPLNRLLTCSREGSPTVSLLWIRNPQGRDVYQSTNSSYPSVAEALKKMTTLDGTALQALDDEALIGAVAGKTIEWRNAFSGKLETTTVSGRRVLVQHGVNLGRTLNFVDDYGYRSVRVNAIEKVA